jgi:hypothetical protein
VVVTSPRRFPRPFLTLALALGALSLSACGGDEAVNGFAGGTSSKDKAPIPPTVQASAGPAMEAGEAAAPQLADTLGLEGPAVAGKAGEAKADAPMRSNENKYQSGRNRDPFASLIGGDNRSDLVDLSVVKLVGVVLGDQPFAIVEDADGIAYVLRKGDRVKNGRVVRITTDALVCSQTLLGYTTTVQLQLEHGKDVKNG